jgi:hypothetical protein
MKHAPSMSLTHDTCPSVLMSIGRLQQIQGCLDLYWWNIDLHVPGPTWWNWNDTHPAWLHHRNGQRRASRRKQGKRGVWCLAAARTCHLPMSSGSGSQRREGRKGTGGSTVAALPVSLEGQDEARAVWPAAG